MIKNIKKTPSTRFETVRKAHLSENTEDYVELISDLIDKLGKAQTTNIAKTLGVAKPTVSKTLSRLNKDRFINHQPYQPITLTPKGKELAEKCKQRHKIVYDFLIKIGVPKNIAEIDSEGVEHHISSETLKIFKKFIYTK